MLPVSTLLATIQHASPLAWLVILARHKHGVVRSIGGPEPCRWTQLAAEVSRRELPPEVPVARALTGCGSGQV